MEKKANIENSARELRKKKKSEKTFDENSCRSFSMAAYKQIVNRVNVIRTRTCAATYRTDRGHSARSYQPQGATRKYYINNTTTHSITRANLALSVQTRVPLMTREKDNIFFSLLSAVVERKIAAFLHYFLFKPYFLPLYVVVRTGTVHLPRTIVHLSTKQHFAFSFFSTEFY